MIGRQVQQTLGHPKNFVSLTSFEHYQLNESLTNVKYTVEENYKNYKNYCVQKKIFDSKFLHPIFITLEESTIRNY